MGFLVLYQLKCVLLQIKMKRRLCTGKSYLKKARFCSDTVGVEVGEGWSRVIGYEYFIHEEWFFWCKNKRQTWVKNRSLGTLGKGCWGGATLAFLILERVSGADAIGRKTSYPLASVWSPHILQVLFYCLHTYLLITAHKTINTVKERSVFSFFSRYNWIFLLEMTFNSVSSWSTGWLPDHSHAVPKHFSAATIIYLTLYQFLGF